jgi:hypothetical protein
MPGSLLAVEKIGKTETEDLSATRQSQSYD